MNNFVFLALAHKKLRKKNSTRTYITERGRREKRQVETAMHAAECAVHRRLSQQSVAVRAVVVVQVEHTGLNTSD